MPTPSLPALKKLSIVLAFLLTTLVTAARADIIWGTSNSNLVSYNTQTLVTSTIPTDLNSQSYGIAYNPTNGFLYVVEREANLNSQQIEVYSTSGADLGTFASGMPYNGFAAGLVFDKSGNLYASFSNAGTGEVEEYFAGGGQTTLPATVGTFSFPNQMTVDSSDNLFISDIGNNNVYEYSAARTSPSLFAHLAGGVGGVATDPAGNAYLSTDSFANVYEYSAGGTLLGNPFSNVGAWGLVYSPGTNSIFGADPPQLNQYNINNSNPATNWSQVTNGFPGTVYLTVQAVPEPSTAALLTLGMIGLLCIRRGKSYLAAS